MKKNKILKIIPETKTCKDFLNIVPAKHFVPEWYRNSKTVLPETNTELNIFNPNVTNSTYKKCTPFFDALTTGYIVYLTSDIEVFKQENGMPFVMWKATRKIVTDHSFEQWDGLPVPEDCHPFVYKWHNDFGIKTPKDYSLLFTTPFNRFDLPFINISGIVDTDSFDLAVHFPFFIKKNFTGIIEKGTPITQIVPIKRDIWKRKIDDYNEDLILIKNEKYRSTIKRAYKKNFWKRKEYN
jgi:hypothetical protein